jgi:hypothetical protein
MKVIKIISFVVVILALAGAVVLVQRQQDTRRGAFYASSSLLMVGKSEIKVGEEAAVSIKLSTGDKPISVVSLKIKADKPELVDIKEVKLNPTVFDQGVLNETYENGQIILKGLIKLEASKLPKGVFEVATLKVKGLKAGTVKWELQPGYSVIADAKVSDTSMEVKMDGVEYRIIGGPVYFATAKIGFDANGGPIETSQKKNIKLMMDSGSVKIGFVKLKVVFDKSKLEVSDLVVNNKFMSDSTSTKIDSTNGWITFDMPTLNPQTGVFELANFMVKPKISTGSVTLSVANDFMVTGHNPSGENNLVGLTITPAIYAIGSAITPTLTPTQTPTSGPTPTVVSPTPSPTGGVSGGDMVLNYRVAFKGVSASDTSCVKDWPLQIIAYGNGVRKVYSGVIPARIETITDKAVYGGSLKLEGFKAGNRVAVFVKGPKHLQMKYGISGQSDNYGKAGGELSLTTEVATSPINDFSGFPILPGDVVGNGTEEPDGWVNALDFKYVKERSLKHTTVSTGGYLKADLDGNCQENSNDVNLLKGSLKDKQDEIY